MFDLCNLKEIESLVFYHKKLKQFQAFNLDFRDKSNQRTVSVLYEFEKLFEDYRLDNRKKKIKTKDNLITYLLLIDEKIDSNIVVLASVFHGKITSGDPFLTVQRAMRDLKVDLSSNFIMK